MGIGLPVMLAEVTGAGLLEWAALADEGPFSSLAISDRLVYRNYEPLVTLAAVSAVTRRVRLMTTVLLATLREATLLAKQAATLDQLSGGRLTLGVGVGGRGDDFSAASVPMHDRGRRFEAALIRLKLVWSGEALSPDIGAVGPPPAQPGGPPLLIGAIAPAALARVGRYGDGFLAPESDPGSSEARYAAVLDSWARSGRSGRPRLVHTAHFALGPDAPDAARAYLLRYYAFRGPAAQERVRAALVTPELIRASIERSRSAGADELILWPCSATIDQVHRLAAII